MAFAIEFDAKNIIMRLTLEGRMTDAVLLDAYATAGKYVASHSPCRGITDFTGVTKFEVSSKAIRQLADTTPVIPTPHMRVVVAPEAHVYGMARMFQILGESTRPNLHIVRTMDDAYRLLQVESPEFRPVK